VLDNAVGHIVAAVLVDRNVASDRKRVITQAKHGFRVAFTRLIIFDVPMGAAMPEPAISIPVSAGLYADNRASILHSAPLFCRQPALAIQRSRYHITLLVIAGWISGVAREPKNNLRQ
jgi:hypothetical protein